MHGSILSFFTPFGVNGLLFRVYDYLLPVMLYCGWSALAILDLARAGAGERSKMVRWAAVVLLVPMVGPALYLLFGNSSIARGVRFGVVLGGVMIVVAAYGITLVRIS